MEAILWAGPEADVALVSTPTCPAVRHASSKPAQTDALEASWSRFLASQHDEEKSSTTRNQRDATPLHEPVASLIDAGEMTPLRSIPVCSNLSPQPSATTTSSQLRGTDEAQKTYEGISGIERVRERELAIAMGLYNNLYTMSVCAPTPAIRFKEMDRLSRLRQDMRVDQSSLHILLFEQTMHQLVESMRVKLFKRCDRLHSPENVILGEEARRAMVHRVNNRIHVFHALLDKMSRIYSVRLRELAARKQSAAGGARV